MKTFDYRIYNKDDVKVDLIIDTEKKELFCISLQSKDNYKMVTRQSGEKMWIFLKTLVECEYVKNFSYYELEYLLEEDELDRIKRIINKDEIVLRRDKNHE